MLLGFLLGVLTGVGVVVLLGVALLFYGLINWLLGGGR